MCVMPHVVLWGEKGIILYKGNAACGNFQWWKGALNYTSHSRVNWGENQTLRERFGEYQRMRVENGRNATEMNRPQEFCKLDPGNFTSDLF